MSRRLASSIGLAILLLSAAPVWAQETLRWETDLASAQRLAAQTNRLVLVHFWATWCGPCVRMEHDVFSKPGLGTAISPYYVPVKIQCEDGFDNPIAKQFGIQALPSDIMMTAQGQIVHRSKGMQSAEAYVTMLQQTAQTALAQARTVGATSAPAASPAATAPAAPTIPTTAPPAPPVAVRPTLSDDRYANYRDRVPTTSTTPAAVSPSKPAPAAVPPTTPAAVPAAASPVVTPSAPLFIRSEIETVPVVAAPSGPLVVRPIDIPPVAAPPVDRPAIAAAPAAPVAAPTPTTTTPTANAAPSLALVSNVTPPSASPPPAAPKQSLVGDRYATATPPSSPAAPSSPLTSPSASSTPPVATAPKLPPAAPSVAPAVARSAPPPMAPVAPPPAPAVSQNTPAQSGVQLPPGCPPLALEGFCPVTMTEKMSWKRGDVKYGAIHRGRTYLFQSADEQQKFLSAPDRFSPVLSGNDPVVAMETGTTIDGNRKFGLMFENRMFFFASQANYDKFCKDSKRYGEQTFQAMQAVGDTTKRR